jgi:arsenate reductase
MRAAIALTICALSALLAAARGSEKPATAAVAAVGVAAAGDLLRSGGHRYLDVR